MAELDTIDLAILRTLQQNGRITNAELADKVGLSASACSRRLDILEKIRRHQRLPCARFRTRRSTTR